MGEPIATESDAGFISGLWNGQAVVAFGRVGEGVDCPAATCLELDLYAIGNAPLQKSPARRRRRAATQQACCDEEFLVVIAAAVKSFLRTTAAKIEASGALRRDNTNVRFGSLADSLRSTIDVHFAPASGNPGRCY